MADADETTGTAGGLLGLASKITKPISLAALGLLVLYGIYKIILALGVFSQIGSEPTFLLLDSIVDKLFYLALVALVLGIGAYAYSKYLAGKRRRPSVVASGSSAAAAGHDVIHERSRRIREIGDVGKVVMGDEVHIEVHIHEQRVAAAAVPRRLVLPCPVADFTGRDAQIEGLVKALRPGVTAAIAGTSGQGGVGKTELARYVGHELAAEFPDGQIEVDMRGLDAEPTSPTDAMKEVVHAFQPEVKLPDDAAQVARVYRGLLAGKRALILLDNARDAAQVGPLVPPPTCGLLVTSRTSIVLAGIEILDLDVMSEEEALGFLRELAGPDRATDEDLDRIAELCGRLPLALRVAGSFLKVHSDWTAARYGGALREQGQRLGRLKEVEASLGLSYEQLVRDDADLAQKWTMLAVFPEAFDALGAAAVWEMGPEDEPAAREDLSALLERSMVLHDGDTDRYRLHDLMRLVEERRLSDEDRAGASYRHAAHYMSVAKAADELYEQGGESILRGLALFDLEWANIEAGQEWSAARAAENDEAARLCMRYPDGCAHCLALRLAPAERIPWMESGLAAARRLKDREAEGIHLGNLGNAYRHLGDARRAIEYSEQQLEIDREIGDRRGEGVALGNMGLAYADLGEMRRAIGFYEQALAIIRELGDRRAEGQVFGNLGSAYRHLGDVRRATKFFEQDLDIARDIGDRRGESAALGNVGLACADLGDARRAIELYEKQLEIVREIGDRHAEGNALGNMGLACADLGEMRRAAELYEQRLAIAQEIGDRRGEGSALGNLGIVYQELGKTRRAIQYYEEALAMHRETGNQLGEGNTLVNLGNAYLHLGEVHRAIQFYEQQLVIVRETGDRRGEGAGLWNMSLALEQLGQREEAIERAEEALRIFEAIEHPCAPKVLERLDKWRGEDKV